MESDSMLATEKSTIGNNIFLCSSFEMVSGFSRVNIFVSVFYKLNKMDFHP